MSRKLFVASSVSLAVSLTLAGADALALGVGGLRVQSALNQPFVGEIDLLDVKPDELDGVKAQIAGLAEFSKVGAERYHYLTKLRFSPQLSPRGKAVIRVSSREPIREPYMDFLMEVLWPKGRLVREYTVLLDPPVTAGRSAPRIEQPLAQPRPVEVRSEAPVRAVERVAGRSAERPRKTVPPPEAEDSLPQTVPVSASGGGFPKYIGPVRSGTGLWRLAARNAPEGATVFQTAMALYRNNQGAFSNGNVNRLSAGKTLVIPSAAELFALEPDAARREFEAALRGERVRREPIAPVDLAAAGAADGQARLRIAGTAQPGAKAGALSSAGAPGMEEELLLVRETSESTRQETVELRGRIRELEAQLSEIQQMLQLRNTELARIQQGVPGGAGASASAGTAAPEAAPPGLEGPLAAVGGLPPDSVPAGEGAPTATAPGESGAATSAVGADSGATLTGPQQQAGSVAPPVGDVAPTPAVPATAETPPAPAQTLPEPETATVASPTPTPPVVPATLEETAADSTWHALLQPLAGIAAVTALGIGFLTWWRSRRRGLDDSSTEVDSGELFEAPSAFGLPMSGSGGLRKPSSSAVPESEELGGLETASSTFASFGRVEPETEDADVIAEADIYIAYGRYREAEDLLKDEIGRSPDRPDLKLKLAEAYFGARNRQALQALIQELQASGAERVNPDQWQRLTEMAAAVQSDSDTAGGNRPKASVAAGDRNLVLDSLDAGSNEVFSLDLGDSRRFSADLTSPGRTRDAGPPGPKSADLLSAERRLRPSPPSARPPVSPFDDESPLLIDEEAFSHQLNLDADSDDLGLDRLAPAASGKDMPISIREPADEGQPFSGGVSDLELNIDDLRAASEVDLDALAESSQIPRSGEQSAQGLSGPKLPRLQSTPLRSVATEHVGGARPSALTGLFGGQEESPSSDLLSSQWQMDSGLWDETATKLDLARAYIEMGDKDSAKGILEEVAGEGNEDQRAEAGELLRRVG